MSIEKDKIKLIIQRIIDENSSLDFSQVPEAINATGESLSTSSISGACASPWNEQELINNIWESIVILEHNGQKVNQSNVMKLLGLDKSTTYKRDDNERQKISLLINDQIECNCNIVYLESFSELEDPKIIEHIDSTCTEYFGSKPNYKSLDLTTNQIVLSSALLPIFNNRITQAIKIGHNEDDELSPKSFMSLVLGVVLIRNKWFHGATSVAKILTYIEHLNNCILSIAFRASINSRNSSFSYLQQNDRKYKFSCLFERYGSYSTGKSSYKYRFTDLFQEYLQDAISLLNQLELEFCRINTINEADLIVTQKMMSNINPRDVYLLMNHLDGVDRQGSFVIKNSNTILDRQESRVYSLFTSLKSETRLILEYRNYDISTCMQTIVSHFVDMEKYPIHQQLIDDKRAFRSQLSEELEKNISEIKEILSASDNGKEYKNLWDKSEILREYIYETEPMVDEFIKYFEDNNPYLITIASSYAKTQYEQVGWEIVEGKNKKQPKFESVGFKKYSMFFFIWTQIERGIRNAMISCFNMEESFIHQVHDAVYSKQIIENKILEKTVLEQTSLSVKIEQ